VYFCSDFNSVPNCHWHQFGFKPTCLATSQIQEISVSLNTLLYQSTHHLHFSYVDLSETPSHVNLVSANTMISHPSEILTHNRISRTESKKYGYQLSVVNHTRQRSLLRTPILTLLVTFYSSYLRKIRDSNRFTKNKHLSSNARKANTESFPRRLQQLVEPMRDTKLKIPNTNRTTYLNEK